MNIIDKALQLGFYDIDEEYLIYGYDFDNYRIVLHGRSMDLEFEGNGIPQKLTTILKAEQLEYVLKGLQI